jgi:hypothetical protein
VCLYSKGKKTSEHRPKLYVDKDSITEGHFYKPHGDAAINKVKGEACETSETQHFLNSSLADGGEVNSLTHRPSFTPQNHFWYLFLLEDESSSWKKSNDFIVNQTHGFRPVA